MTIAQALATAAIPRLDAEVILAFVVDRNRTWLVTHRDEALTFEQQERWDAFTALRQAHMPVAYITGTQEFFGRPFHVTTDVLIPRPATEQLIQTALEFLYTGQAITRSIDTGIVAYAQASGKTDDVRLLVDIGTGSGCIAVTLALELPDYRIIATDVSSRAIAIAKENAAAHGVADHIEFRMGEGMEPLKDINEPFVIISNPPYIPDGTELMDDVADFEPPQALFAGLDGIDVIRQITEGAKMQPFCRGFVIECQSDQVG